MIAIQRDFTNQFGININGFMLVVSNISLSENTQTTFQKHDDVTPQTYTTKQVSFSANTYPSEAAFTSGVAGMPLSVNANGMQNNGYFNFSDADVTVETLVSVCHDYLLGLMFPENTPQAVPFSITRRQALQQLTILGEIANVETLLAAIPDQTQKDMANIYWDESTMFERSNPFIISISTGLGWSTEYLDSMFITASGL